MVPLSPTAQTLLVEIMVTELSLLLVVGMAAMDHELPFHCRIVPPQPTAQPWPEETMAMADR